MITGLDHSRLAGEVIVTARGERCFFCDEPTEDPAIVWFGATGEIFLHAACTAELAVRLFRDLHELEHRSGGRLAWRE
jgi:hypothetical protein